MQLRYRPLSLFKEEEYVSPALELCHPVISSSRDSPATHSLFAHSLRGKRLASMLQGGNCKDLSPCSPCSPPFLCVHLCSGEAVSLDSGILTQVEISRVLFLGCDSVEGKSVLGILCLSLKSVPCSVKSLTTLPWKAHCLDCDMFPSF